MEREINKMLQETLNTFMGDLNVYLPKLETKIETELIELFQKFGIQAIVKTDKYSLPQQDEVIVKLRDESYIAGMYERSSIYRPIVKKVLETSTIKIRFYIHIETFGDESKTIMSFLNRGFKYSFRYYIH